MRHAPTYHRALRFAVAAAATMAATTGAIVGCGPNQHMIWFCLNPVTGKVDDSIYDDNNYANGEPDPCHCYDACGPAKSCPIEVDAGPPLGPGCSSGGGG